MSINNPIRIIKNLFIDMRVGGHPLAGSIQSKYKDYGAKNTTNSAYTMIEEIFEQIEITPNDVLVDVGCGKGRVLNWWILKYPDNKIFGIELDPDVAAFTKHRLRKYRNVNIITGDVINNIPANGTIFFMFNPFSAEVMEKFKNKLIEKDMCDIRLIYLNSVHVEIFEEDSNWDVQRIFGKKYMLHPTAIIKRKDRL